MRKFLYVVLVGIVLTFVACAKNTSDVVTPSEKAISKGSTMTLVFEANPTTGFSWTYETKEGDEYGAVGLISDEYVQNEAEEGMAGVGGHTTYVFEGLMSGKQELRFIYRRPWEGGETACDVVYEIDIDDKLNMSCTNKKKGIIESEKKLSDFPDPTFSN